MAAAGAALPWLPVQNKAWLLAMVVSAAVGCCLGSWRRWRRERRQLLQCRLAPRLLLVSAPGRSLCGAAAWQYPRRAQGAQPQLQLAGHRCPAPPSGSIVMSAMFSSEINRQREPSRPYWEKAHWGRPVQCRGEVRIWARCPCTVTASACRAPANAQIACKVGCGERALALQARPAAPRPGLARFGAAPVGLQRPPRHPGRDPSSSTFCPPPPPPLLPHTAPSCLAGHPPPHPGMAPSGPVSGWSVDDVAAWLTGDLSLPPAAADAFKENAVAGGGARPQRFQSQLDAPSL